jgi:hypothetical protein
MREFEADERAHLESLGELGDLFEFYLTTGLHFVVDIARDYLEGGTADE